MLLKYSKWGWVAIISIIAWNPIPAAARDAPDHATQKPTKAGTNATWLTQTGTASYYGSAHQGKRTASGRRFDQKELTAAHQWLPFGTRVRVTAQDSRRFVIVVITDRLQSRTRVVDLSLAAARQLGMIRQGIARVSLAPA